MNYFNKKNLTIIAIVLLLIMNITAISTIVYQTNRIKKIDLLCDDFKPHFDPEKFMKNELQLTPEQQERFRMLREQHISESKEAHRNMRLAQENIFNEMSSDKMDSLKLDSLFNIKQKAERQLQFSMIRHYRLLRAECNNDQIEKLNQLFHAMFLKNHHHNQRSCHGNHNKMIRKKIKERYSNRRYHN